MPRRLLLDQYSVLFPNFIYLHLIQPPFKVAKSYFESLPARVDLFIQLQGGVERAEKRIAERCQGPSGLNLGPRSDCVLTAKQLLHMSNIGHCKQSKHSCDFSGGAAAKAWRCMSVMLWAEVNAAVREFGLRCLNSSGRFILWHSEDLSPLVDSLVSRIPGNSFPRQISATFLPLTQLRFLYAEARNISSKDDLIAAVQKRERFDHVPDVNIDIEKVVRCAQSSAPLAYLFLIGSLVRNTTDLLP
jgi:hypothetical protein